MYEENLASVHIRPIVPGDRGMVAAFFDQMGGESRAFFDRRSGNRNSMMACFDQPNPNRRNFAAVFRPSGEAEEEMAGLVFLWNLHTKTPWLGIAVAEQWKGRHLGRKLMAYAETYCLQLGKGGIFLTTHLANIRGQALYLRCGYEQLGTSNWGEVLFFRSFPDAPPEDGALL